MAIAYGIEREPSVAGSGAGSGDEKKAGSVNSDVHEGLVELSGNADALKRHLGNRQLQLIAVGGSIGTALFVSIATGLISGGPGSLFIAYAFYTTMLGLVNNSMAEMCCYMPVSGSFIRMAGKWVDEAFGFMAGWNFFLYEAFLIPFEVSALNLVLTFWRDDIPVAAVCAGCIVLFAVLNVFAVKWYGEAEFWLASGKLLLILIVFSFTFVTMVGGNPTHDAYGFRYWNHPGAFAESVTTGALGRFEGFLGALWSAAFTCCGPEYLAMVAGETKRPRVFLKQAFKTVYWRFGCFFIGGALAVGIIIPYNDPRLVANAGTGTAAGSPYVVAMQNMGVSVLPHLTNALMVTSIFSAGNAYTYCAMRSLYGLALEGQAPRIFRRCTKSGIPIYCFGVVMIFPVLSFLCVSGGTAKAVSWFANLTEAAQIIDYIIMSLTYICFYRALQAQGIDRRTLPYRGWFQPYCGYIGAAFMTVVVGCYGYKTFLPAYWDVGDFFAYYTMIFVAIITFSGYKVIFRTKFIPAAQADLVWDKPIIDAYEASLPADYDTFWGEVLAMVGIKRRKHKHHEAEHAPEAAAAALPEK